MNSTQSKFIAAGRRDQHSRRARYPEKHSVILLVDKAVAYQDRGLSEIVAQNLFDKIHSDPRWRPFLRKIGKAPEQLAQIKFKVTLPP